MAIAFEKCPRCGCEYEPGKIYTLPEIAVLCGVSMAAVHRWLAVGLLKYRIYARAGRSVARVVFAVDYLRFRVEHYQEPENLVEGSTTQRAWNWRHRMSVKGGLASVAARRAKKLAQQSTPNDP